MACVCTVSAIAYNVVRLQPLERVPGHFAAETIAGHWIGQHRLRARLETLRDAGRIAFGMHVSGSALITCIIADYSFDHVHFLDGSSGSYAAASIELKAQLKARNSALTHADAEAGEALRERLIQIARCNRRADSKGDVEESLGSPLLRPKLPTLLDGVSPR